MAQKTETRNIFQKMNSVMSDLDGKIEKDGQVTYGNKYKYVSIAGLTNEIRRALVSNGLVFYADLVIEDRSGKGLIQTYKCTLANCDAPDEKIQMHMAGSSNDQSPTSSGICLSSAVKNCFLKMFCLAGDDDDAEAHSGQQPHVPSITKKTGPKPKLKAVTSKPVQCTVLSVNKLSGFAEVVVKTKEENSKEIKTLTSLDSVIDMAQSICDANAECMIVTRITEKGNVELVKITEIGK